MFKSKNVDITGGPIVSSVLLYSIPIIIGSLIQVLFNAADLMVLGQMTVDETATAAVGATSTIIGLLVNSFIGLSAGVSVVFARCLGEGNSTRAKKVLNTSMITSLALGVLVMILCLSVSRSFLHITECPEACFQGAVTYMNIYALGIPAMMVYNFGSAIIRTTGDTQRPLIYLIIAGAMNVVLNFILCLILEEKVAAVAIATAVSQLVGAVLVIIHLCRIKVPCGFSFKSLGYSFTELIKMLKIGVPCGLNSALFSIANLQIQAAVNSFGAAAIAGGAAACSVESIVGSAASAFAAAALPFVGQNVGAGNKKRVKDSIVAASVLSVVICGVASTVIYLLADPILSLYLPKSPEAVLFAKTRMLYVLVPYAVCALYNTLVSAMQAFGYSFIPMMNSIITVLVFRLLWMQFIYPVLDAQNRSIHNLYVCFTISWLLCLVAHSITFFIIYAKYKKGRVKAV